MDARTSLLEMTADIVSAYVGSHDVSAENIPDLFRSIHVTLHELINGSVPPAMVRAEPAVNPKKSITADYLVCLEDGKRFKSLKRHLRSRYDMSPEEYRAKWGLPADYPMVAPNYAKERSLLAKKNGLGKGGRREDD